MPDTLLQLNHTLRTPKQFNLMLTRPQSMSKPFYDVESLQISEIAAFKVDHTAYNSYLYTGKMKVPINSTIAREDEASTMGALAGKNIYIRQQPIVPRFSITDDQSDDDNDDDNNNNNNDRNNNDNNDSTENDNPNNVITPSSSSTTTTRRRGQQQQQLQQQRQTRLDTKPSSLSSYQYTTIHDKQHDLEYCIDEDGDEAESDAEINDLPALEELAQITQAVPRVTRAAAARQQKAKARELAAIATATTITTTTTTTTKPTTTRRGTRVTIKQSADRHHRHRDDEHQDNESDQQNSTPKQQQQHSQTNNSNTNGVVLLGQSSTSGTISPNVILSSQTTTSSSSSSSLSPRTSHPNSCHEYKYVPIVVKYPLMGSMDDWKDSFEMCQEEVVMYRQIQTWRCPYLLRYYGTHGPGLVFEFVDGESLDGLLFDTTDVDTEAQIWSWSELGLHISTALLYLHKLNISHNDIKPENVRYSQSKKCWKLLDLGLATDFDQKVSRNIGTNGYRCPYVHETGLLTRTSDVYGLGIMMEDALKSIIQRYHILEDIYDEYDDVLEQYAEEQRENNNNNNNNNTTNSSSSSTSSSRHLDIVGEIDLEEEAIAIVKEHVKRRKYGSPPISTTNTQFIMEQGQQYVAFIETARKMIDLAKNEDPAKRPGVTRLTHYFQRLAPIEDNFRKALALLRAMGVQ